MKRGRLLVYPGVKRKKNRVLPDEPELFPEELKALQCVANGMTQEEAATHLHKSYQTIKTQTAKCRHKLTVGSTREACNKAIQMGLIK